MQELEKILEEIEAEFDRRIDTQLKIMAGLSDDVYRYGYGKSLEAYQQGKQFVADIIHKHMNDGWIPVEKELPQEPTEHVDDEDELKEYIVMIDGAMIPTTLSYAGDGHWLDVYEEESEYYPVIAWQPLPEPYRPERSDGE